MLVVTGLCGRELYFMFNSVKDTQEKSNFINVRICHLCFTIPQQAQCILSSCIFTSFKFKVCVDNSRKKSAMFSYIMLILFLSSRHQWPIEELINADESLIQRCYNLCYFCQHLLWRLKVKFASGGNHNCGEHMLFMGCDGALKIRPASPGKIIQ